MSPSGPSGSDGAGESLDADDLKTYVQEVMDWTAYQAEAYVAVVQHEPIEPNEIVALTNVPQGRVYDVMGVLEGVAVNTQSRQPKRYQAQHPRALLSDKKEEFNEKADSAIAHLEQQHEVQRERITPRHPAWIVPGISGTKRELLQGLQDAKDSVRIADQDGLWIQPNEIRDFSRIVDNGISVEIMGWSSWRETLEQLAEEAGVTALVHEQVDASFTLIDDELAIIRVGDGTTGVKIEDEGTVNVLEIAFESLKEEATDVHTNA